MPYRRSTCKSLSLKAFCGGMLLSLSVFSQARIDYNLLPLFTGAARDDAAAFSLHGELYLVGGLDENFNTGNDVWKQGANTSWTLLANLPAAGRQYARVFAHNGNACIIGGYDGSGNDQAECWCFNAATLQWAALPYPPAPARRQHVAATGMGIPFFGLGMSGANAHNDWWSYKAAANTWTRESDFPGAPRKEAIACAWGGAVFAGIGMNHDNSACFRDFYRFDVLTRQWEQVADFPGEACGYQAALPVSTGILVLTGVNESMAFSHQVYLYRPDKNEWQRLGDYPYPGKKGTAVAWEGDRFYLLCGVAEGPVRTKDVVEGSFVPDEAPMQAFPNPFDAQLFIRSSEAFSFELYTLQGQLLLSGKDEPGMHVLQTPFLNKGMYVLVLTDPKGVKLRYKLLKL